jgi:hypothetical protein
LAAVAVFVSSMGRVGADTIAWYRFEEGADFQAAASPIPDTTGMYPLLVEAGSDAQYRAFTPADTVPKTGDPNTLSMEFTSLPAFTTDDPSFNIWDTPTWTIEAYVYFKTFVAFHTFVGKDGTGFGGPLADLYLQRNGRNNAFSIIFKGMDGSAQGGDGIFQPVTNTWYHVAAVYDSVNVALYVDGVLDISFPITSPMIVEDTPWTVGRGFFGNPTDPSMALVDEVRFSDAALTPDQFLNANP